MMNTPVSLLVFLFSILIAVKAEEALELKQPYISTKAILHTAPFLRISGPLNWLGWNSNPYTFHVDYIPTKIKLEFDPPLKQNIDFEIGFFDNNTLPRNYTNYNYKSIIMNAMRNGAVANTTSLRGSRGQNVLAESSSKQHGPFDYSPTLYVKLLNKEVGWISNKDTLLSNPSAPLAQVLYLKKISNQKHSLTFTTNMPVAKVIIGDIKYPSSLSQNNKESVAESAPPNQLHHHKNPQLPLPLPDSTAELDSFLRLSLAYHHVRVFRVSHLKQLKRKITSMSLLKLSPPLLLIDATESNSLDEAAVLVDAFLTHHSVLDISWEPLYDKEPRWWVLTPKPSGMPGHLSVLLDNMQFRHPEAQIFGHDSLKCNGSVSSCVPGCNNTKVIPMIASGWGGDTGMMMQNLMRAVMNNYPVQLAPVRLGKRTMPPIWEGVDSWPYMFQGCNHSNFVDCFFLDHSNCPRITFDPKNYPGKSNFDKKRLEDHPSRQVRPSWWSPTVGFPSKHTPEETIEDLFSYTAQHIFYTFFLRPNFRLRREVDEMFQKSPLKMKNKCAVLHVRRGDILFHDNQARSYVHIDTYLRAARAYLDVFGIKNVILLTDSAAAIEEAKLCSTNHPDICSGLIFQWVDKKRWIAGEGGWENPFPSGSSRVEFMNIMLEYTLSQQCDLMIQGETSYGDRAYSHMCCKNPLKLRGQLPNRCVCPTRVKINQYGFDCAKGNKLMCYSTSDKNYNFTLRLGNTEAAFANLNQTVTVVKLPFGSDVHYKYMDIIEKNETQRAMLKSAREGKEHSCRDIDHSFRRRICD